MGGGPARQTRELTPPGANRHVDGGVRSLDNIDLATGDDRVLVDDPRHAAQVARLTERGAHVEVVTPDERSAAIFAGDPLDPAVRAPAAQSGRWPVCEVERRMAGREFRVFVLTRRDW